MTKLLPRFTPAMAVAILAIAIALSSSATAALMITGHQIKNKSVTQKDLKKGAVRSKQVKNRSLRAIDLKKNAIRSAHIRNRSITQNDLSFALLKTVKGGATGFQVVTATGPGVLLLPRTASGTCPVGKVAISANAYSDGPVDIAPPAVQRTGDRSFTAEDSFPIAVLGVGNLVLQITCVKAG